MKPTQKPPQDPLLQQWLGESAPVAPDLSAAIMEAVSQQSLRRLRYQRNLRWAMSGVGGTLMMLVVWIFGGGEWAMDMARALPGAGAITRDLLLNGITVLGMGVLFVELELLRRFVRRRAFHTA